jgi:ribosomal protein L17
MKSNLFKALGVCFGGGIQQTGKGVQLAGKGLTVAGVATIDAGQKVEQKGAEIRKDLDHKAAAAGAIEDLDKKTKETERHNEALARLAKAEDKERRRHQKSIEKIEGSDEVAEYVETELVPATA